MPTINIGDSFNAFLDALLRFLNDFFNSLFTQLAAYFNSL
jgi:hypothetical protein